MKAARKIRIEFSTEYRYPTSLKVIFMKDFE